MCLFQQIYNPRLLVIVLHVLSTDHVLACISTKSVALLQDQGFEDTKPVIEALKSKGITKIGAAGFCWGG